VTNSWRIGGVQLQLREDGTFSIYQPDSNRVMPKELALQVARAIADAYSIPVKQILDSLPEEFNDPGEDRFGGANLAQSTVGGGVISTSDGPQLTVGEYREEGPVLPKLTDTEQQADRNALETSAQLDVKDLLGQMTAEAHADGTDETVTDFGPPRTEKPKPPVKRRPGRPRKTT
jgi:hypothetical protein